MFSDDVMLITYCLFIEYNKINITTCAQIFSNIELHYLLYNPCLTFLHAFKTSFSLDVQVKINEHCVSLNIS